MTIHLGAPLPIRSCNHPNLLGLKRPRPLRATRFLLGFASGGACHTSDVTITVVGSYPTVSPLPSELGGLFSVALSLGLPRAGVTRRLCFMKSGLSSPLARCSHPAIRWGAFRRDAGFGQCVRCKTQNTFAFCAWCVKAVIC